MGSEYAKSSPYQVGDDIFCLTTMTALPIHIEKIHKIDYNFGELVVTGYGIIFLDSPLTAIPCEVPLEYTMVAFDEAANFYAIYQSARRKAVPEHRKRPAFQLTYVVPSGRRSLELLHNDHPNEDESARLQRTGG